MYVERTSYVVLHIARKFWFPHFCGSYAPWNLEITHKRPCHRISSETTQPNSMKLGIQLEHHMCILARNIDPLIPKYNIVSFYEFNCARQLDLIELGSVFPLLLKALLRSIDFKLPGQMLCSLFDIYCVFFLFHTIHHIKC